MWLQMVDVIRGHEGRDGAGATEIWIGGAGPRPDQ